MKLPLNEAFVDWARASGMESFLIQAIREEIDRKRAGVDQETFFETLSAEAGSAKGHWMRAVKGKRIVEPKALVKFLRLLRPTIEIDVRTEPWNRWKAGSRVIVVVGKREVSIPEVSKGVKQRAVGARDSEAFAELSRILYRDLGLDCEIVLEHLPAKMTEAQALERFNRWRRREDTGMICVLGSPVVNPLANALAREVLTEDSEATPREPPVRFRWAYQASADNFLADRRFPRGKSAWLPKEEGLAFPGMPTTSYPRVSDDSVVNQISARRSAGKRRYADAGLLMMDCRHPTMLLLCAGHGGAGTLGCVRQLRERTLVEALLEGSRAGRDMPGRFVAVVDVRRERPETGQSFPVDDLEIVSSTMVWASAAVPGREWS